MNNEMTHTIIPGYDGYAVSHDGKVFSVISNWRGYGLRELAQDVNSHGYPSVRLLRNGKRVRKPVHCLVAKAFLPSPPSLDHEICHIDGDKANNHISNLRWGTRADNAADRERHGRTSRGISHSMAIKQGMERSGFNVKW